MSEKNKSLKRIKTVAVLMAVVFFGLGFRVALLHTATDESELLKLERRTEKFIQNLAGRGNIFDRNGNSNVFAINLTVWDVGVDPFLAITSQSVDETASFIASIVKRNQKDIVELINKNPEKRYICVKKNVLLEEDIYRDKGRNKGREKGAKEPKGIILEEKIIRNYPLDSFMCHVLGFVNNDGQGGAGIELLLDSDLKGTPGMIRTKVDAKRNEIRWKRLVDVSPKKGADVYLTIDQTIQYIVEKTLDEIMDEYSPKGTWAIVQRVKTGEILAMANRPCFDLNNFSKATQDQKLNRAIGTVYEPGSTLKAATIALAIEKGTVTPDTVINCENGVWMYKGKPLRDHGSSYGMMTVADGLKKSSNILAAKVGLTMSPSEFEQSLRSFGLGRKLGIDLPGEETGILYSCSKWSGLDQSRIAIGQSVATTALQILGVFCAIANDGYLMRPYIVSRVVDENGEELKRNKPEIIGRPISSKTSSIMKVLLTRVTESGGTGTSARISDYTIAGKTGTAQKPENGGYAAGKYIASFVGFAPADEPEIGLIVVVDEPSGGRYYGGQVAAPAFSKIAEQTLRYLDISPSGGMPKSTNVAKK